MKNNKRHVCIIHRNKIKLFKNKILSCPKSGDKSNLINYIIEELTSKGSSGGGSSGCKKKITIDDDNFDNYTTSSTIKTKLYSERQRYKLLNCKTLKENTFEKIYENMKEITNLNKSCKLLFNKRTNSLRHVYYNIHSNYPIGDAKNIRIKNKSTNYIKDMDINCNYDFKNCERSTVEEEEKEEEEEEEKVDKSAETKAEVEKYKKITEEESQCVENYGRRRKKTLINSNENYVMNNFISLQDHVISSVEHFYVILNEITESIVVERTLENTNFGIWPVAGKIYDIVFYIFSNEKVAINLAPKSEIGNFIQFTKDYFKCVLMLYMSCCSSFERKILNRTCRIGNLKKHICRIPRETGNVYYQLWNTNYTMHSIICDNFDPCEINECVEIWLDYYKMLQRLENIMDLSKYSSNVYLIIKSINEEREINEFKKKNDVEFFEI